MRLFFIDSRKSLDTTSNTMKSIDLADRVFRNLVNDTVKTVSQSILPHPPV